MNYQITAQSNDRIVLIIMYPNIYASQFTQMKFQPFVRFLLVTKDELPLSTGLLTVRCMLHENLVLISDPTRFECTLSLSHKQVYYFNMFISIWFGINATYVFTLQNWSAVICALLRYAWLIHYTFPIWICETCKNYKNFL